MGYTTTFEGGLKFDRELTHKEWVELRTLSSYDNTIYADYTDTPETIPNSYLQWEPNEDGTELKWNGGEKFYDYIHWLRWLIKHYMKPHELVLNGEIRWRGEEFNDTGTIVVINNVVTTRSNDDNSVVCPNCSHRFTPGV